MRDRMLRPEPIGGSTRNPVDPSIISKERSRIDSYIHGRLDDDPSECASSDAVRKQRIGVVKLERSSENREMQIAHLPASSMQFLSYEVPFTTAAPPRLAASGGKKL